MNDDKQNENQGQDNVTENEEPKLKYSQEDLDKLAANKAKEAERKQAEALKGKKVLSDDELQKLLQEATQKGAERAKMTAEEKAKADEADRAKAIEEERQSAAQQMADMNSRLSLYETKDALVKANIPAEFASFLNNIDSDKRDELIGTFADQFNKAVDARVAEKLKGSSTPQTGGNASQKPKITKTQPPVFDATKMSVTDFMATDTNK